MNNRTADDNRITALYERLSRDDELAGDSSIANHIWAFLVSALSVGYGKIPGTLGKEELFSGGGECIM